MQFIYCNAERISEGICNEGGAETPLLAVSLAGANGGDRSSWARGSSSKPGRGPRIPGGGREQPVWVTGSGAAGSLPTSRGPASSGQGRPRADRGAPTASSAQAALGLTFSRFSSHCPVLGWGRAGTAGSAGGGERGGQPLEAAPLVPRQRLWGRTCPVPAGPRSPRTSRAGSDPTLRVYTLAQNTVAACRKQAGGHLSLLFKSNREETKLGKCVFAEAQPPLQKPSFYKCAFLFLEYKTLLLGMGVGS